ncbi:MAG: deoxyribose-phosphate aldolase [Deltaproteobacteria bacterium]|nr:deoxyribose-phosphate aldolase [Deltaproteobacteria bacterium]
MCTLRRPWSVRAIEDAGAVRVAAAAGVGEVPADMARLIDHTLLKADATREDVRKLCEEARKHHFASVCVNTTWVPFCRAMLAGSGVMVCTVVGFPLGAMSPNAKAFEAREAVRAGADEVDMVLNIGALKSKDYNLVFEDICKVVQASKPAHVKVILETGALDNEQKVIAISLSKLAGAHFVKTSTGFGPGGATVDDIALMRRLVGSEMGVKASGGVRTREDAENMARAGASRIGASASVAIVSAAPGSKSAPAPSAAPAARSFGKPLPVRGGKPSGSTPGGAPAKPKGGY